MGIVSEVKTLGAVTCPNGKLSTGEVYFAKQNVKTNDYDDT